MAALAFGEGCPAARARREGGETINLQEEEAAATKESGEGSLAIEGKRRVGEGANLRGEE